jgi:hypothetical protein
MIKYIIIRQKKDKEVYKIDISNILKKKLKDFHPRKSELRN